MNQNQPQQKQSASETTPKTPKRAVWNKTNTIQTPAEVHPALKMEQVTPTFIFKEYEQSLKPFLQTSNNKTDTSPAVKINKKKVDTSPLASYRARN